MKTKNTNKILKLALWTSFILVSATILDVILVKTYLFVTNPVEMPMVSDVKVPRKNAVEGITGPNLTPSGELKQWALKQFEANGINPMVADCVIWGESRWDANSINESSLDFGILQWNIQHIKSGYISLQCAATPECAVSKAIEKIKKDGGFKAWMAHKNNNCGRFGSSIIK